MASPASKPANTTFDQTACVICMKSDNKSSLTAVTPDWRDTLIEYSELNQSDALHAYLLSQPEKVLVHSDCERSFADRHKIKNINIKCDFSIKRPRRSLRSLSTFVWKEMCLICGKNATESHPLFLSAMSGELRDTILKYCRVRGDDWGFEVQGRLESCCDFPAEEGVYHESCYSKFVNSTNLKRGRPVNDNLSEAFATLCEWLEGTNNTNTYTLEELCQRMGETSGCAYSCKHLKKKLQERYNDQIVIAEVCGRKNVVRLQNNEKTAILPPAIKSDSGEDCHYFDSATQRLKDTGQSIKIKDLKTTAACNSDRVATRRQSYTSLTTSTSEGHHLRDTIPDASSQDRAVSKQSSNLRVSSPHLLKQPSEALVKSKSKRLHGKSSSKDTLTTATDTFADNDASKTSLTSSCALTVGSVAIEKANALEKGEGATEKIADVKGPKNSQLKLISVESRAVLSSPYIDSDTDSWSSTGSLSPKKVSVNQSWMDASRYRTAANSAIDIAFADIEERSIHQVKGRKISNNLSATANQSICKIDALAKAEADFLMYDTTLQGEGDAGETKIDVTGKVLAKITKSNDVKNADDISPQTLSSISKLDVSPQDNSTTGCALEALSEQGNIVGASITSNTLQEIGSGSVKRHSVSAKGSGRKRKLDADTSKQEEPSPSVTVCGPSGPVTWTSGTSLEAQDFMNKWYPAKIVAVDPANNAILIHFNGWNQRYDEWLKTDSQRLRPLTRPSDQDNTSPKTPLHKIGENVLARWTDNQFYPGRIMHIKPSGSYDVLFYDGLRKTVQGANIKSAPQNSLQMTEVTRALDVRIDEVCMEVPGMDAEKYHNAVEGESLSLSVKRHTRGLCKESVQEQSHQPKSTESDQSLPIRNEQLLSSKITSCDDDKTATPHCIQDEEKTAVPRTRHRSSRGTGSRNSVSDEIVMHGEKRQDNGANEERNIKVRDDLTLVNATDCTVVVSDCLDTDTAVNRNTDSVKEEVKSADKSVGLSGGVSVSKPLVLCIKTGSPVGRPQRRKSFGVKAVRHSVDSVLVSNLTRQAAAHTTETSSAAEQVSLRLKCPYAGCPKMFRNSSLVDSHVKYYHPAGGRQSDSVTKGSGDKEGELRTAGRRKSGGLSPVTNASSEMLREDGRRRRLTISMDSSASVGTARVSSGDELVPILKRKKPDNIGSTKPVNIGNIDSSKVDSIQTVVDSGIAGTQLVTSSSLPIALPATAGSPRVGTLPVRERLASLKLMNCQCKVNKDYPPCIQCTICQCWQHLRCVKRKSPSSLMSGVNRKYICFVCTNTPGVRDSAHYAHDQDWLTDGRMADFHFVESNDSNEAGMARIMKVTHELVADLHGVRKVMHGVNCKIAVVRDKIDSELKLWAPTSGDATAQRDGHLSDHCELLVPVPSQNVDPNNSIPVTTSTCNDELPTRVSHSVSTTESLTLTHNTDGSTTKLKTLVISESSFSSIPSIAMVPGAGSMSESNPATIEQKVEGGKAAEDLTITKESSKAAAGLVSSEGEISTSVSMPAVNERILLEHIDSLQDSIEARLALIEEQVTALENAESSAQTAGSVGGGISSGSDDVLRDLPRVKKTLHQLLLDLACVEKMSLYHH